MRAAGKLSARCLAECLELIKPGVTTGELDDFVAQFARDNNATSATMGYRGFPAHLCTSINEVICHGIPSPKVKLVEGDIVGIDITLILDGFYGDNAATVPVGEINEEARKLLDVTLESLKRGIAAAQAGNRLGDIGHAIQSYVEPLNYGVVRDYVGHGIGRAFHEEPAVSHVGRPGVGPRLAPGMTFTIEPMINLGSYGTKTLSDNWTVITADRKLSAQFEHTIAITEYGPEILTAIEADGEWEAPGRATW